MTTGRLTRPPLAKRPNWPKMGRGELPVGNKGSTISNQAMTKIAAGSTALNSRERVSNPETEEKIWVYVMHPGQIDQIGPETMT